MTTLIEKKSDYSIFAGKKFLSTKKNKQWRFFTLKENDLPTNLNEIPEQEFRLLSEKSGALSFWENPSEDVYDENDGTPIEL